MRVAYRRRLLVVCGVSPNEAPPLTAPRQQTDGRLFGQRAGAAVLIRAHGCTVLLGRLSQGSRGPNGLTPITQDRRGQALSSDIHWFKFCISDLVSKHRLSFRKKAVQPNRGYWILRRLRIWYSAGENQTPFDCFTQNVLPHGVRSDPLESLGRQSDIAEPLQRHKLVAWSSLDSIKSSHKIRNRIGSHDITVCGTFD